MFLGLAVGLRGISRNVVSGEGIIVKLGAHHAAATRAAINAKIPEEDIVLDPANPIGSARALLDAIFTHTDTRDLENCTGIAARSGSAPGAITD